MDERIERTSLSDCKTERRKLRKLICNKTIRL